MITAEHNRATVVRRDEISSDMVDAMHLLLADHFHGVSRKQFERDLSEKSHVVLIHKSDKLVGFSTLLAYETHFDNEPCSVIYSGDTIVSPEAWGSTALFRAWIAAVKELRHEFPRGNLYWLLLTSGFRTYRLLPVFWREFFPRFELPTPPSTDRLLHHLARERFNKAYDEAAGIVRFAEPQRLREDLCEVPKGRTRDDHIAFFLSKNPNHARGDELVCITLLDDTNLTAAGRRMIR